MRQDRKKGNLKLYRNILPMYPPTVDGGSAHHMIYNRMGGEKPNRRLTLRPKILASAGGYRGFVLKPSGSQISLQSVAQEPIETTVPRV
jgi:hypothetical protein